MKSSRLVVAVLVLAAAPLATWTGPTAQTLDNVIKSENARPGNPEWRRFTPTTSAHEVEGYPDRDSVDTGQSVGLHLSSSSPTLTLSVYRFGYYNGTYARRWIGPVTVRSTGRQAVPAADPVTGLIECHWPLTYTIDTRGFVTGHYFAEVTTTTGYTTLVSFTVRDDFSHSDILFDSAIATGAAYNAWGGKSIYVPFGAEARKVSLDRPSDYFHGGGYFFAGEANAVVFLEANGYDVSYTTDVDMHANGGALLNHRVWMDAYHSEYWSHPMRDAVQHAINNGVGAMFLGGNTMLWQIRFEPNALGAPNRTVVAYKMHWNDPVHPDPASLVPSMNYLITNLWDQPRLSAPAEPSAQVIGISTAIVAGAIPPTASMTIVNASAWPFRGTGLVNGPGFTGLLGPEVDGITPLSKVYHPDLTVLVHTVFPIVNDSQDITVYTGGGGNVVFAAGSERFAAGLGTWNASPLVQPAAQRLVANVLSRMITGR